MAGWADGYSRAWRQPRMVTACAACHTCALWCTLIPALTLVLLKPHPCTRVRSAAGQERGAVSGQLCVAPVTDRTQVRRARVC